MKIRVFFLAIFASFSHLIAQESQKPSLLYKITGNGITEPSYIFGTFHIMCKDDFSITPEFEKAIKSTKQVYEELKMDDPKMMMKAITLFKSDSSLKSLLGEEKYNILDQKFKEVMGYGIGMFNNMKPMMLSSTLTMKMISCENTIQPEGEITKVAKANSLEVFGLETIEDQIEAFNTTPLNKQINDVFEMVNNIDSSKQMMTNLIETYKKRDPQLLYNSVKNTGMSGDFEENLLTKRNKNWIPIMVENMKKLPTFFAVGAGHLGGELGVLNLLKKEGFILEPIYY